MGYIAISLIERPFDHLVNCCEFEVRWVTFIQAERCIIWRSDLIGRSLSFNAAKAGSIMAPEPGARESRRSTRVRLKVRIEAKGLTEPLACEGETVVVNRHGALISTTVPLRVGMRIEIHVLLTINGAQPRWSTSILTGLGSVE